MTKFTMREVEDSEIWINESSLKSVISETLGSITLHLASVGTAVAQLVDRTIKRSKHEQESSTISKHPLGGCSFVDDYVGDNLSLIHI